MDTAKEEKLLTGTIKPPESESQPPEASDTPDNHTQPNRLQSCLTVLGGSLALFCGVGFLNAFGIFQEHYKSDLLRDKSESDISWIGSVSIFLTYILSPLAGVLVDRFGPTALIASGSLAVVLSIFMTSLCKEYYQFFLAQAVLFGAGTCFLTLPPISVASRCLPTHRGLAIGAVVGGSSIGGVVWPIMLERLLNKTSLSFGWVMRIVAFTMLPLLAFATATIRAPATHDNPQQQPSPFLETPHEDPPSSTDSDTPSAAPPTKPPPRPSPFTPILTLLHSPPFLLLSLGLAIVCLGMYIPLFYIVPYSISVLPPSTSSHISFYLLAIINAASLLGRTVPGHLADLYLGHFNVLFVAVLGSGVIAFCWTAAGDGLGGLVVWSVGYGFGSGAILSLQSACAGRIAADLSRVSKIGGAGLQGTAMGLVMGLESVTSLVGNPIGGNLLAKHGYLGVSMFTGASLVTGSVLIAAARLGLKRDLLAAV